MALWLKIKQCNSAHPFTIPFEHCMNTACCNTHATFSNKMKKEAFHKPAADTTFSYTGSTSTVWVWFDNMLTCLQQQQGRELMFPQSLQYTSTHDLSSSYRPFR